VGQAANPARVYKPRPGFVGNQAVIDLACRDWRIIVIDGTEPVQGRHILASALEPERELDCDEIVCLIEVSPVRRGTILVGGEGFLDEPFTQLKIFR